MWVLLQRFKKDTSGATAIEYGLMTALIAVAIIASVTNVGQALIPLFESASSGFTTTP